MPHDNLVTAPTFALLICLLKFPPFVSGEAAALMVIDSPSHLQDTEGELKKNTEGEQHLQVDKQMVSRMPHA